MCIVCNVSIDSPAADDFLVAFGQAQRAMKQATEAMLRVSKDATSPKYKRQYDVAHKLMKRMCREWNKIEHVREGEQLWKTIRQDESR